MNCALAAGSQFCSLALPGESACKYKSTEPSGLARNLLRAPNSPGSFAQPACNVPCAPTGPTTQFMADGLVEPSPPVPLWLGMDRELPTRTRSVLHEHRRSSSGAREIRGDRRKSFPHLVLPYSRNALQPR